MLVDQARTLGYRAFARALAYWAQLADPDGTDRSAEAQHAARRLHLSQSFNGGWVLDALFDPIHGAVLAQALGAIEQELFEADWAEARSRFGDNVRTSQLARTPAQRRADALVEMARRAMAVPGGARLPEPLFTVLVGYETFAGRICELAERHRGRPRGAGAMARPGLGGAGGLRRSRPGEGRGRAPADLHRGHPPGGGGAGPGVLPPHL